MDKNKVISKCGNLMLSFEHKITFQVFVVFFFFFFFC